MPKHHISIDDETMDVLKRSDISPNSVKLPTGQLPRPLYEKVNKVLTTAGGKWNRSAQAHVFTSDPREVLGMALDKGAILDTKKASQAFYTPAELARRVVLHASVEGKTVLEPSAGHGSLAKACRDAGAKYVVCIEQDATSSKVLSDDGFGALTDDFLKVGPTPYDRVVMNPPFTNGQDVDHVTHAFKFLTSGGRLVSIMSPSWRTKQDKRSEAFRELVANHGRVECEFEPGAFKESGTNIVTVLVILEK